VVYVDGFCGPGRYSGGEPGSPLIALDVAKAFAERLPAKVVFLFTDEREDRVQHLRRELAALDIPPTFHIDPEVGRFDEVFLPLLEDLERSGGALAPAFVFIDPFGFSGVPFTLVERVLKNPHCEVFVTFMVNALQRFVEHPYNSVRIEIESLFGTSAVAEALAGPGDRGDSLRALYQRQLESQAKFVRSFEIRDTPGRVMYHLFFASNHPLGHLKMKEAMWKADPSGAFRFADNTDPSQLILLDENPAERLVKLLAKEYKGRRLLAGELKEYVRNRTAFVDKHATAALRLLEDDGRLRAETVKTSGRKRRKGTYPDDTVLVFS
jgi:three-Cys-motif partner protein